MLSSDISQLVKLHYEVVLVTFRVYHSAAELFYHEKSNLSLEDNDPSGWDLANEDNVFRVDDMWIYASEWYDAAYDE